MKNKSTESQLSKQLMLENINIQSSMASITKANIPIDDAPSFPAQPSTLPQTTANCIKTNSTNKCSSTLIDVKSNQINTIKNNNSSNNYIRRHSLKKTCSALPFTKGENSYDKYISSTNTITEPSERLAAWESMRFQVNKICTKLADDESNLNKNITSSIPSLFEEKYESGQKLATSNTYHIESIETSEKAEHTLESLSVHVVNNINSKQSGCFDTTNNGNSERRKSNEISSHSSQEPVTAAAVVADVVVVSNGSTSYKDKSYVNTVDATNTTNTNKKIIIQCNSNDENNNTNSNSNQNKYNFNDGIDDNNDDDDGRNCNSSSSSTITRKMDNTKSTVHLECDSDASNSLKLATDCASGLSTTSEISFEQNARHVIKIKITPKTSIETDICANLLKEKCQNKTKKLSDNSNKNFVNTIYDTTKVPSGYNLETTPELRLRFSEICSKFKSNSVNYSNSNSDNSVSGEVCGATVTNIESSISDSSSEDYIPYSVTHKYLTSPTMVQKSQLNNMTTTCNAVTNAHSSSTSNTSVTDLNVTNPSYLYYMMSQSQFLPCDTFDSGTCSDMETNSNGTVASTTPPLPPPAPTKMEQRIYSNCVKTNGTKLKIPVESTKVLINSETSKASTSPVSSHNGDHQRAGSLTDSEESESSSLSCESLHSSSSFLNMSSTPFSSAVSGSSSAESNCREKISTLFPDSLLRDIRDRKFHSNDFSRKYNNNNNNHSYESVMENETEYEDIDVDSHHSQNYIHERDKKNMNECRNNISKVEMNGHSKHNKTFILNVKDGIFEDTKMNSMPRTYEADKYYNFHVNERDSQRSFSDNSKAFNGVQSDSSSKSSNDDAFAGYRDVSSVSNCSDTSTIRSSKGTVRGVKNRVRNGIATFLQLQQTNVKVSVYGRLEVINGGSGFYNFNIIIRLN